VAVRGAGAPLAVRRFRDGVWRELRRRGLPVTPTPPRARIASPAAWRSVL
jgi:hypothetical protein